MNKNRKWEGFADAYGKNLDLGDHHGEPMGAGTTAIGTVRFRFTRSYARHSGLSLHRFMTSKAIALPWSEIQRIVVTEWTGPSLRSHNYCEAEVFVFGSAESLAIPWNLEFDRFVSDRIGMEMARG